MRMAVAALGAGLCLALSGCATMTPQEQAALEAQASRPVTCETQDDCAVKWGRAMQWVLNNSSYKIQSQSDSMIQTMGPLPNDPSPAFVVSKIPVGNGKATFDFRAGCDNIFGCVPSLTASRASFVSAVMGD